MARGHGRISSSIWEDSDFLALTQQQQRLYLFLISQPNLNHAGLLPLTLRRWARKASGLVAAELERHLGALAAARFIVLDEDTEELLIRSFVRNDGVWKQPKVMGAMVSGALEIESRVLRRSLLEEMDRIPLEELSDEPTKVRGQGGLSIRRQVSDHIETLRREFGTPLPTPSEGGCGTPSVSPSATSSGSSSAPPWGGTSAAAVGRETHDEAVTWGNAGQEPPAEPLQNPPADGGGEGAYARGRAHASRARSPAPAPAPLPNLSLPKGPSRSESEERDLEETAAAIAGAYANATPGAPVPRHVDQVRAEAADLLAAGHHPNDLMQAVVEMAPNGWRDIGRHLAHRRTAPSNSAGHTPFTCQPDAAYLEDPGF